jgi:uncharacterized protein
MNDELNAAVVVPDKDARNWAMICHLAALAGYLVPFGNVLGPLIIWAIKKDDSPFIDDQGKEALNFQLTMTLGFIASFILMFVLIGFVLIAVLCIYMLIMVIIASIKANEGIYYRYPYTFRFF